MDNHQNLGTRKVIASKPKQFVLILFLIALVVFLGFYLKNNWYITLDAFGFEYETSKDPIKKEMALGESVCVLLQGYSSTDIVETEIIAKYGLIIQDENGTSQNDLGQLMISCSVNVVDSFAYSSNGVPFASPFEYVAPKVMPDESKDIITVKLKNKHWKTITRKLTVILVE